jgi:hypothetical protein
MLEQSLVLRKLGQKSTDGLICIQERSKSVGVGTGDLYLVAKPIRPEKTALGGPGHTYKQEVFDRTPDKRYEIADIHEQVENFAK